ncbi:Glutamate--tRNA ligase [Pontiella desulfatans]|uniref:Glutamate--tRNA ligase n=1 Tax=Pontiella desulfatans TaxID=2750659 RepID=A0A6C2UCJ8_PONDE|nr:glutamate--tRNA ligase family protein [Pontiella desulfatans]VGO17094.1 Glutamate--tRNA ligase [Pontiella desulfatans]
MLTRFAPSLTGYLHLGHVLHMLYVWGIAKLNSAKVLCRIEDHDLARARPEYEAAILENLQWLGFVPDLGLRAGTEAAPDSDFRQSDCSAHYETVLQTLQDRNLVYGCDCSRKQILERAGGAASASSDASPELHYPGTCAGKNLPLQGNTVRFRTHDGETIFHDLKLGEQRQTPRNQCGDFSLRDRQGQWTYQFACVCDDIRQGVGLVIRGEDILFSTARQIQLFNTLEASVPQYCHHPLLHDAAGKKLSKRQRSDSISRMREAGATPGQIIGQALFQAGLAPDSSPLSPASAIEKYIIQHPRSW